MGSVLTGYTEHIVHTVAETMTHDRDLLLMHTDVLYDARIASALVAGSGPMSRVLIDGNFEAGDEPQLQPPTGAK